MPKLKTHKGAQKRFDFTGTGKLMRTKGGKSHLRRNKSARAKIMYERKIVMSPADSPRIKRLLPYGS